MREKVKRPIGDSERDILEAARASHEITANRSCHNPGMKVRTVDEFLSLIEANRPVIEEALAIEEPEPEAKETDENIHIKEEIQRLYKRLNEIIEAKEYDL